MFSQEYSIGVDQAWGRLRYCYLINACQCDDSCNPIMIKKGCVQITVSYEDNLRCFSFYGMRDRRCNYHRRKNGPNRLPHSKSGNLGNRKGLRFSCRTRLETGTRLLSLQLSHLLSTVTARKCLDRRRRPGQNLATQSLLMTMSVFLNLL